MKVSTIDMIAQPRADGPSSDTDRFLLDQSAEAILVTDRTGRILDLNPAAAALVGLPRDDLLRLTLADIALDGASLPAEADALPREAIVRFRGQGGGIVPARLRHAIGADGLWRAIGSADGPLPFADPGEDDRLRAFGDASQDVLWIRDARTLQWRYVTPAFDAIFGLSRETAAEGDDFRAWLDLIVPEDRQAAADAIERVRHGERVTFEYRICRPEDRQVRWLCDTAFAITDARGEVALIGGIGHDQTGTRRTEDWLQTLMGGIPQLIWRADTNGGWTWAGPQWTAYTGQAEAESRGDGWLAVVHPDDRAGAIAFWQRAVKTGRLEMEGRVRRAADNSYRWFKTRATPVRDRQGRIVEWLGTSTDVDDLRRLQQRQQLLVAELQHRVRNVLTVVRSVFARTVEAGRPIEEISGHFRGRLDNLARTQVIVTQSASGLVDLDTLVREELLSVGAVDGARVAIDGPDIDLTPAVAETIGLAVHELTTNALKYGALKVDTGSLEIRWEVAMDQGGNRHLTFRWHESGVPAVPVGSGRVGFGSELILEALPYRLGAETALELRGGGIVCTIALPLPPEAEMPPAG
ncbi:MAG: PAS domain-containing protein [Sphingomonas fennica]